jgi:hypothetical protein
MVSQPLLAVGAFEALLLDITLMLCGSVGFLLSLLHVLPL